MDLTSLIGPAVVAAVISGLVAGINLLINRATVRRMHVERLSFDREQAERRVTTEIALTERKMTADISLAENLVHGAFLLAISCSIAVPTVFLFRSEK